MKVKITMIAAATRQRPMNRSSRAVKLRSAMCPLPVGPCAAMIQRTGEARMNTLWIIVGRFYGGVDDCWHTGLLCLLSYGLAPVVHPLGNVRCIGSGCCARATTGHAVALPSPAMNSRRRIRDLPR
jgi:hypothetical protein